MLRWNVRLCIVLLGLVAGALLCTERSAFAISAGVFCPSITDTSASESSGGDIVAVQRLSDTMSCGGFLGVLLPGAIATAPFPVAILLNSNNDGSPNQVITFKILYHASVTNVQRDGNPYANGDQIAVATADNFSATFTFTYNSTNLQFTVTKAANTNTLGAFTVQAVDSTAPTVAIGAPAETRGPFTATFTFSESVTGFAVDDITVGNGTASSLSGGPAVYTATITPLERGTVTIDVAAGVAQDAAANLNTAAAQVSVAYIDENFVRTRTQRVVRNFITRRADQITASDPDLVERLSLGGVVGNGGPVAFTGEGGSATASGLTNRVEFSTSLRQMLAAGDTGREDRRAALAEMAGLGMLNAFGTEKAAGVDAAGRFDIWLRGKWVEVDSLSADSEIGLFYVGADYRFTETFLMGVMGQFDWTDETDAVQRVAADGNGWLAGPYVVARLHDNLLFDASLRWGQADNTATLTGLSTGSFNSTRWLARATLTGEFTSADGMGGAWYIAPSVGVLYFEEAHETYTDSLGIVIPGQTLGLGRVTFGPKISYRMTAADGTTIAPHVGIRGIWDFDKAEIVDLTTGLAAGSDDLRARAEAGLSLTMPNGWSLSGEGFYDGIGADDYETYGGSATLVVPLN